MPKRDLREEAFVTSRVFVYQQTARPSGHGHVVGFGLGNSNTRAVPLPTADARSHCTFTFPR
jgi:hypothetical protein